MLSKKLYSIMLTALTTCALVACGPSSSPSEPTTNPSVDPTITNPDPTNPPVDDTYFTVTFYDDGRVYGEPVQVKSGDTVAEPTAPKKDNTDFETYTFNGWITVASELYDFSTPVTSDLDLYSDFTTSARDDYDLVVFVYGINGAEEPTTYISDVESEFMRETFVSTFNYEEKNILWHYSAGKTNKNFNKYVNDCLTPVDLVISGNKLDNDDYSIETHAEYGKVHLGAGWIENTSRYLSITSKVNEAHMDMAVNLYNMLQNIGPNYKVTLDSATASLQVGDTKQLTATYYGDTVTFTSSNDAVATVSETGLVTAISAGEATITATDLNGNTATCEITVSAAPIVPDHDLVIVLNNSNASNNWMDVEDAENLVKAFQREGQAGYGKDIELNIVSGVNIAGVVSAITELNTNDLGRVDAALCREAFFTNKSCPAMLDGEPIVNVDASWAYSGGQFGIFANAFEEHLELARAFAAFVSGKHIDSFDIETSISLKIGETYQLNTVPGATFATEDANITVSESGFVTAIAAGSAKITVTNGLWSTTISVTVTPEETVAVTLNIYVHTKATKYYVTDEGLELIKSTVEAGIGENVTVNWTTVTGKNADVTTAIDEAEETVHFAISAKAAIEDSTTGYYEGFSPVKVNANFVASGESRYMGPLAGISMDEYLACMTIVDLLK